MRIKSVRNLNGLSGKKVLLRLDLNVPIKNGKIKDDYKIVQSLETVNFLIRKNAKIILISHLGRPDGKIVESFSLSPVAAKISDLLGKKIKIISDFEGFEAGNAVAKMDEGDVLMFENIRFHPGEDKNNRSFAKNLARLADIYVNDAFAVSHRLSASVGCIKDYIPSYAGLLLEQEVLNLGRVLNPKKPLILVMGGAKISTKIALMKNLEKKSYRILVGGGIANNFLAAHNFEIGRSLSDKESIHLAEKLKDKKIIFPIDVVVSSKKDAWEPKVKILRDINKDDYIFDIGPRTIKLCSDYIKKANTIIWNGPLGMFEVEKYKHGSIYIGRVIASRSKGRAFGVVGGGETVEAVKMTKMMDDIDWVSTGGGAMLTFLSGQKMPGLKGIVRR